MTADKKLESAGMEPELVDTELELDMTADKKIEPAGKEPELAGN